MRENEKAPIVLVAAKEDVLNNLRDALVSTNLALFHAHTKNEAIALLELLESDISLAIVELEHSGGLDLIHQLTRRPRLPMKIIATTSRYPAPVLAKIIDLGVDAVVPEPVSPEKWRITIEAVLHGDGNPVHTPTG